MLATAALAGPMLPRPARAQPAPRVMRVAFEDVISNRSDVPAELGVPGFDVAGWFAAEGFVEGRNLALEYMGLQKLVRQGSNWGQKLREVVASRPDVILVIGAGGPYLQTLKRLTSEVPIVFYILTTDPVRMGLVESLRRPGGNLTGTAWPPFEAITIKSWELLKELRPAARRIGALLGRDDVGGVWMAELRAAQIAAAARLGLERVEIVVRTTEGFAPVERAIRSAQIDLLDPENGTDWPWRADLLGFLARSGIPAVWDEVWVKDGGLLSLNASFEELSREAVRIVAKILRGEKPATIPVYVATRFKITVNLRTARAMKLTIPPSILLRADVVVE